MALLHYLKFSLFHLVGLLAAAALLAAGTWTTAGLCLIAAFYVIGDALAGDDASTPRFAHPGLLTWQLWLALPLLCLIVFCAVWSVSAADPLGAGAWLGAHGLDLAAAHGVTSPGCPLSAIVLTALMIGMIGTIPAHELTHRTRDPVSMLVGRWLLAFSLDTVFSIEHVYGHHRYVAMREDPATAPRGRTVYRHIVASTLGSVASGWRIESERLARRGQACLGWHNRFLRGQLMSVVVLCAVCAIGGLRGLGFFLLCALLAKALLETVNYMEHYGLVRAPGTPVQPRHSWNTNRRLSSWSMFNLTRHSHHHAQAGVQFQDLRPFPQAPMMIAGYLTTILVTLLPPLWFRLMAPRLAAWDRDHASAAERALVGSSGGGRGA